MKLITEILKTLLGLGLIYTIVNPTPNFAEVFTIDFTGELESLTTFGVDGAPNIDTIFDIGDGVTGRIIVDSDNVTPTTISVFDLSISTNSSGTYNANASSGTALLRNDNMAGSAAPFVDSIIIAGEDFTAPPINGLFVDRLQFSVGTENLSILDASSVVGPTEILNLWNDTPNYFSGNTNFVSFDNDETARFALTSVTVVPEPSAYGLYAIILGAIGIAHCIKIKNRITTQAPSEGKKSGVLG